MVIRAGEWFLGGLKKSGNVPSGGCEEIDPRNFSGDPKCIPTPRSSFKSALIDKFSNADSAEFANLDFFTRSCPRVPVPGFRVPPGSQIRRQPRAELPANRRSMGLHDTTAGWRSASATVDGG
jgi:hypothetical protein